MYVIPVFIQVLGGLIGLESVGTLRIYFLVLNYMAQLSFVVTFVPRQPDIREYILKCLQSKRNAVHRVVQSVKVSQSNVNKIVIPSSQSSVFHKRGVTYTVN